MLMDPSLILPYLWVLVVLVFLEGLLAADNAIVMAFLRCSGGKCLTITAITIALSAANKPSKNTKTTSTLAADNAIVMAVMVKHLPPEQRKKALFYGLLGAFVK
jgi:predicted tellurium resistance membrane protein TerC